MASDAKLSDDVQDFLGDAAEAVAATFTVTYREGDKTTTLTQRPPDRRVEVVTGTSTEAVFRLRDGVFACQHEQGRGWECGRTPSGGVDPDLGVFSADRVAATAKALGDARATYDLSITTNKVAGVAVRCLVAAKKLGDGSGDELCIAASGAILRIRSAAASVEAERYREDVPDEAFTLPAEPR